MPPNQWITEVIRTQIQQYSLKCCFIVWGTVSPLLFLFLDGFNLFAYDRGECYWAIIVPVIEEQLKMLPICPGQSELAPGLKSTVL